LHRRCSFQYPTSATELTSSSLSRSHTPYDPTLSIASPAIASSARFLEFPYYEYHQATNLTKPPTANPRLPNPPSNTQPLAHEYKCCTRTQKHKAKSSRTERLGMECAITPKPRAYLCCSTTRNQKAYVPHEIQSNNTNQPNTQEKSRAKKQTSTRVGDIPTHTHTHSTERRTRTRRGWE
jgi:hypothetical protein